MRISLAGGMGLVAMAAILFRWPGQAYLFLAGIAWVIAFRMAGAATPWWKKGVLLGAIYGPCLPGFWTDCDHCRRAWLQLFPIAPTVAPTLLVLRLTGINPLSDHAEFALSAIGLLAMVGGLSMILRKGRSWWVVSVVVGLVWSSGWAWVLHRLIRS